MTFSTGWRPGRPHLAPQPLLIRSQLPGRYYLQALNLLFRENQLASGSFIALGPRIALRDIRCPLYLLAGDTDDITTKEQVFVAPELVGTPPGQIEQSLVPGGHIGLFMGTRTLAETWPSIAAWLLANGAAGQRSKESGGH